MNYKISLEEMNRLGKEKLSRQLPATLQEKKEQYRQIRNQSSSGLKKKKS
jgi:hypothetical protein